MTDRATGESSPRPARGACGRSRRDPQTGRASRLRGTASCCADRISASMISMAISLRFSRPATRYQTDVARSWGSIGSTPCPTSEGNVNVHGSRQWHEHLIAYVDLETPTVQEGRYGSECG